MKIALVSPYDFSYPGGVTEHVKHLAGEFGRLGHEVHILAPCSREPVPYPTSAVLHRIGRAVAIPANGSVARIELSIRAYWKVKRLLREEQFDVIHLHEPLLPALPLSVLRHSRALNVGTFHAYRRSNFAYFYARLVAQPLFNKLHGLIAVSRPARDFVAEYFPSDYQIIPNGVDFDRFSAPVEPTPALADGGPNVLFVGRLEKRKGLTYLLRAWGDVRQQHPRARLIVVGDGRPRKSYERYARRRGWDEVKFAGYVPDDLITRYFQSADVFCAPSTGQESFGIVLLEAMAAGRPVVASDIPGYTDVISAGVDGLQVRPKKPRELAAALCELLADPARCHEMGQAGQRKAELYRWDLVAARVLAFYEEAARRRQASDRELRERMPRVKKSAHEMVNLLSH